MRFPSAYCTDRGRAINNFEPDWPQTLTGFAKKAHAFYEKELAPLGYKVRAQIMDYPDGMLGDVGIFLRWSRRVQACPQARHIIFLVTVRSTDDDRLVRSIAKRVTCSTRG